MAHSIKAASDVRVAKHSEHESVFSRFVIPIFFLVPRKFSEYRRVNASVRKLKHIEDKIYRYKLHWGFSHNAPLSTGLTNSHEEPSVNKDFLSIDDLDEVVRGLIFKVENYSFFEKLFDFDAKKFESHVLDCELELSSIIASVEREERKSKL